MNKDYTTAGAFWTKVSAVLFLGSALCLGSVSAQTAKSAKNPSPKERAATPQTDSRWEKGGLFEGFTPQQEIKEKRTRNAKHFYNADGSITAQIGRALHYKDAQGIWQDIDLRVIRSSQPGYGFANEANDIKSYFPQAPGQQGVAMNLGGGAEFSWWQNPSLTLTQNGQAIKHLQPQAVAGSAKGQSLTYAQVYPGISEEFVVLPEGLENNTIIHSLTSEMANLTGNAALEFEQFIPLPAGFQVMANGQAQTASFEADRFSIRIPGMEHGVYFGEIVVFDGHVSKDEAMMLAHMPTEKLTAAQQAERQQSIYKIAYRVRFVNGGIKVVSKLPAEWLQDANRTFPVVIDPTVTITPTGSVGNFYGPMSHWYGYQRHADLYLNSEVGAFGSITQIEYNSTTTGTAGSRPTKIYMRTTPATTLTGASAWNSATYTGTGATLCLDANTDQGNTTGWKALTLTSPFTYDQGNLLIMVGDYWGGSGAVKYYSMSPSITARQAYNRVDGTDPGDGASLAVENYLPEIRITYNSLSNCTGLPTLGAATASTSSVCAGINFTLNLPTAPAEGGISYQWQSSTDGTTWNNLGSAQNGASYATSQTQITQYRVIVTCVPATLSDTSDVVMVTMSTPTSCYCTPEPSGCGLDDEIQNVTFGSINNNSSCSTDGYQNYIGTVAPATVTAGLSYPITVTVGDGGGESIAAWIDYNQNGIYEMSEYTLVGVIDPGGTVNNTITIPGTALPGTTRMRVRNFFILEPGNDPQTVWLDTPNSSCVDISTGYGETEDYAITIVAGTSCGGTPTAGTATSTETAICAGESFNLGLTGGPTTVGITYQWQSSTNGGGTWSNLGSSQAASGYTVANQAQTTQYRLIVTCTNSSQSDTTNAITVTQNAASACYCINNIPFNCTDGDVITNVTFATINNNSTCGNATVGYSDYTVSVAAPQINAGSTVPVSVTVGPSGAGWLYESVGVWIDYNQNGLLDSLEGEYTDLGTGLDEALTGNVAVPAGALAGNTRMRVVVAASIDMVNAFVCGPLDPNENYGEMEDYTVTIISSNVQIDSVVVNTQGNVPAVIAPVTGTLQLEATVYPTSQPQTVTWSIVPGTGTATINASGLVTGQTAGTVWGKAVSTVDQTKMDSILITINATPPVVDSVVVTTQGSVPAVIATPTGTLQLQSTVYPTSQPQTVIWSIVPGTGTATISGAGLVTGQTAGTVWGKAVATVDQTKMDSILITINPLGPVTVDSVVVKTLGNVPAAISAPSGSLQLQATVYPTSVSQSVTWSIVPVSGAATINGSGLVIAQSNGTVWGKAVSTVDATKSDSILITITNQNMGVEESLSAMDFNAYPNPTSDVVTLKSGKNHLALEIQVMDITGKVLLSRKVQANELNAGVTLDMATLASGTYILKLQGEGVLINKRVVRR